MYSTLGSLVTHSPDGAPVRIKVKVFRRVEGHDSSFMPTLDFLLVDRKLDIFSLCLFPRLWIFVSHVHLFLSSKGTKIHATVNTQAYRRFEGLPEGACAQINGAIVSNANWNDWNHFLSTHKYMLVLPSDVTVTPIAPLSDHHFFNFTPFENVISDVFNVSVPVGKLILYQLVHNWTISPSVTLYNSFGNSRECNWQIWSGLSTALGSYPLRRIALMLTDPYPLPCGTAVKKIVLCSVSIFFEFVHNGNELLTHNIRGVELYCIAYGSVAENFSCQWRRRGGPEVRCLLSEWRVSQSRSECAGCISDNWIWCYRFITTGWSTVIQG